MGMGAYAPLVLPKTWTFEIATSAYDPEHPKTEIGTFKRKIVVDVIKALPDTNHWLVKYTSGIKPVFALIDTPDLSITYQRAFEAIKPTIERFPILHKQLSCNNPWPGNIKKLAKRLFEDMDHTKLIGGTTNNPNILRGARPIIKDADGNNKSKSLNDGKTEANSSAWGLNPLTVDCDYSKADHPKIIIEFWNKSDGGVSSPFKAKTTIQTHLKAIEAAFQTRPRTAGQKGKSSGITAIKSYSTLYYLPNGITASLRYKREEYLLLELEAFTSSNATKVYDAATFKETILSHVEVDKKGNHYISTIPMISQGDKGYCAAATLARVLSYYGYQVDMHSMADLAKTSGKGGTSYKAILASMRRICSSTPFKMEELDKRKIGLIHETLEQGIPIIWGVPGHMRLLIGYHPENAEMVYTDSWGAGHEFKTMTINDYINMSVGTWILQPKK